MSFADSLANATAPTGDYDDSPQPPPVGTYEVVIVDASAFTSKKQNQIVKFELRVATGDHAGHTWTELFTFNDNTSQKAFDYFKGVCERLQIDTGGVNRFEEMDDRVKVVVDKWFAVDVVAPRNPEKWDRNSVFFKDGGPLTAGRSEVPADTSDFQPARATAAAPNPADDDIPF